MTIFGDNGLAIPTLEQVKAGIFARYKAAYGDNVRVDDPDGVVGRHAHILAEVKHDILTELAATVAALLPSTSRGTLLEELVKFNGIGRNVATKSTATVEVTATSGAGCTIPEGSIVATSEGVQFETELEVVLGAGLSDFVTVTAIEEGAQEAAAGTITEILTPVYGWESVTNASAATPGDARETDPQLRTRRWERARGAGFHGAPAILSALKNISGVTRAKVEINEGNATNENGVPPHTVRAIVFGGADQDIGDCLFGPGYGSVGGGVGTHGQEDVACVDSESGQSGTIHFDRAEAVNIYVVIETKKSSKFPDGGNEQIIENVVNFFSGTLEINGETVGGFDIGEAVEEGPIYTPCNLTPWHKVQNIYIGRSANPTSSDDVAMDSHEFAVTDSAKVSIVEVG